MRICRPGSFPGWQIYFLTLHMFTNAALVRAVTLRFGSLQQGKILRSSRRIGTFTIRLFYGPADQKSFGCASEIAQPITEENFSDLFLRQSSISTLIRLVRC